MLRLEDLGLENGRIGVNHARSGRRALFDLHHNRIRAGVPGQGLGAFVHVVTQENRSGSSRSLIGHSRLDGVAYAQIQVMLLAKGGVAGSIVDVEYMPAQGRHRL